MDLAPVAPASLALAQIVHAHIAVAPAHPFVRIAGGQLVTGLHRAAVAGEPEQFVGLEGVVKFLLLLLLLLLLLPLLLLLQLLLLLLLQQLLLLLLLLLLLFILY